MLFFLESLRNGQLKKYISKLRDNKNTVFHVTFRDLPTLAKVQDLDQSSLSRHFRDLLDFKVPIYFALKINT